MAGYVGKDGQRYTDNGRIAGGHTIHSIVEIRAVGDGSDHEDGHQYEENPAYCLLVLAYK